MRKHIILHGHFYQPPREDPWTGMIDLQGSAAPYPDWNHRITAECYAACGSSRILDGKGAILSILNNYRYLSFNFGPTLLSWMEDHAPNTYQRIIDADRESMERLGHGNALAQSYNHTILPLDNQDDARTQIRWGLQDFRFRFKRPAEGMWLPECAVNERTVDILISEEVKFIILSPWQAHSIRSENGDWEILGREPAPSDRPFFIERPEGRMAVFFYNPGLASGISFGHLLRSREGFEEALRNTLAQSDTGMISIATDGEIYGHHEPFGDMCFSSLIDHLGEDSDISFTNYASYLENHPPVQEVKLRPGDEKMGTSWSCAHGVGRWMRDCGCSTGGEEGWNQSWRTPLRDAFDNLRIKAEPLWGRKVTELTGRSPREILNAYGKVLSGMKTPWEFTGETLKRPDASTRKKLLEILEGAKFLQFMYTSCGWFFSDLSGIEPVQNIRYAYRAAELIDPDGSEGLSRNLQSDLSSAESNIPEVGNGSDILARNVIPDTPAEIRSAGLFFWSYLYNLPGKEKALYGIWKGQAIHTEKKDVGEASQKISGNISFTDVSTSTDYRFDFNAVIDKRRFCPEINLRYNSSWITVSIDTMPTALRKEIQRTLLRESENTLKEFLGSQASQRLLDLMIVQKLNVPFGASGWQSLELSLYYGPLLILDQLEKIPEVNWKELLKSLDEILKQREAYDMNSGNGNLEITAGKIISGIAGNLQCKSSKETLEALVLFLEILHKHQLQPLRPAVQNSIYALLEKRFSCREEDSDSGNENPEIEELVELAELVNINPERFA